jgi:hypothetical protein
MTPEDPASEARDDQAGDLVTHIRVPAWWLFDALRLLYKLRSDTNLWYDERDRCWADEHPEKAATLDLRIADAEQFLRQN